MFDWSDPQTVWLNITNLTLGIVTVLAVLAAVFGIVYEVIARRTHGRVPETRQSVGAYSGTHILDVPGLGLTMADGGEPPV